ncbi:MAG TPA: hypothetical protein VIY50_00075 [Steroidobacteraceae bacterium]
MTNRFAWSALLLMSLALGTVSRSFAAADFERAADEPPGASLSGAQVLGPNRRAPYCAWRRIRSEPCSVFLPESRICSAAAGPRRRRSRPASVTP